MIKITGSPIVVEIALRHCWLVSSLVFKRWVSTNRDDDNLMHLDLLTNPSSGSAIAAAANPNIDTILTAAENFWRWWPTQVTDFYLKNAEFAERAEEAGPTRRSCAWAHSFNVVQQDIRYQRHEKSRRAYRPWLSGVTPQYCETLVFPLVFLINQKRRVVVVVVCAWLNALSSYLRVCRQTRSWIVVCWW